MKENILDILIYLFENYMFDSGEFEPDQETLITELSQAGFDHLMIDQAFDWLENLATLAEDNRSEGNNHSYGGIRYYSKDELELISVEARGLILKLEQCGVLDHTSREIVISQIAALGAQSIDLEHVKWVILMVLSNYSDGDGVTELTESLVLDGLQSCAH